MSIAIFGIGFQGVKWSKNHTWARSFSQLQCALYYRLGNRIQPRWVSSHWGCLAWAALCGLLFAHLPFKQGRLELFCLKMRANVSNSTTLHWNVSFSTCMFIYLRRGENEIFSKYEHRRLYTHLGFRVKVIVAGFGTWILAILQVFLDRTYPHNRVRLDFFFFNYLVKSNGEHMTGILLKK